MTIDYSHDFTRDEARERLEALGDYLHNKHGISVSWNNDRASFKGKYLVVKFSGELSFGDGIVHFRGEDPGMLWRKRAVKYLTGKLDRYLDPKTPVGELPRGL
jgi:hypothetical protein